MATTSQADLPHILFTRDVAELLGIGLSAAREAVKRGELGPYLHLNGKLALLRDSMLKHLEDQLVFPVKAERAEPTSERARHFASRLARRHTKRS